jgi:hypothetical protein
MAMFSYDVAVFVHAGMAWTYRVNETGFGQSGGEVNCYGDSAGHGVNDE